MAAEINDIVSKQAIDGIKAADVALIAFDATMNKSLAELTKFTAELKKQGISYKDLATISKAMSEEKKRYNETERQATKILQAAERAEKARVAALDKAIAKEKAHTDALKLTVKTMADAKAQNSALRKEIDKLSPSIASEKKKLDELNATVNKNTAFLKENSDAARQQGMNVGNYASAWDGVKKYAALAGGVLAGVYGAIKLGEAVIKTSQYATDEWAKTTAGLTNGWNEFLNSVANWDFNNLIDRINEAAKAGRDYAEVLDLMDKRQKGLSSQHKQENEEIAKLRLSYYEHNKSAAEKAAIMQKVIDLTQSQSEADAASAKQNYEGYLSTIIRAKGINKSTLESYLLFKGTTEEKVQLIEDLKNAENYYNANAGILGETDPGVQRAYRKMIELRVKGVGAYSVLESKLNQEQIDNARNLFDAVAETNNAVYENKEGFFRKMEMQEKKNENIVKKSVEKQVTQYEKLTSKISDLQSAMIELRLANQPVPDSMVRELISSQTALENVKKEVEAIALGMVAIQSKGANLIPTSGATPTLSKRAQVSFDNSTVAGPRDKIFEPGEASQFAIEQAQVTADATFQIIADYANAELDLKLSNLEKEKEAKLSNAKLTEAQRAKIEADYEKKAAKLKTEQAKKQKAAAIVQAIINTALAVTAAMTKIPFSAGAAISAGIAGAAQIAVISAQKVPQFDAGTASTPDTFIAGERRPEWMIEPSGRVQLVTKPTMFKGMAGATVIGGEQTRQMIEQGITPNQIDIRPEIQAMRADIVNTIRNKRELHISASGSNITERQGDYYKTYLFRKVQWAGKKN